MNTGTLQQPQCGSCCRKTPLWCPYLGTDLPLQGSHLIQAFKIKPYKQNKIFKFLWAILHYLELKHRVIPCKTQISLQTPCSGRAHTKQALQRALAHQKQKMYQRVLVFAVNIIISSYPYFFLKRMLYLSLTVEMCVRTERIFCPPYCHHQAWPSPAISHRKARGQFSTTAVAFANNCRTDNWASRF